MKPKLSISLIVPTILITTLAFAETVTKPETKQQEKPLPNNITVATTQTTPDDYYIYEEESKTGVSYKEVEVNGQTKKIYNGHFVLYNAPLLREMSWFQPPYYNSYQITITNNSDVPITITYGPNDTKIIIDPNTTKTITDNNAEDNTYYKIDINNVDGSPIRGTISVRVSDLPL